MVSFHQSSSDIFVVISINEIVGVLEWHYKYFISAG